MRIRDNIDRVLELQPDYMGFIFYKKSPRYVGMDWEGPGSGFPDSTAKVGVFVNAQQEEVTSMSAKYALRYLQLHGDESPEYCQELAGEGYRIIKALGLSDQSDLQRLDAYTPWVQYFLFDTPSRQYGGTGTTFDWSLLTSYNGERPFFLSGGLSTKNVLEVAALNHSGLWALDVNSRFETAPGLKDLDKLKEFKEQLKRL